MRPPSMPERAIREVKRIVQQKGIVGFCIATCIERRDLSNPVFLDVFAAIEACDLPLFLHPVSVIGSKRLTAHYLTNLLGNPLETGIAAAHLIFGGVLDRFPRLRVVLPHAGGVFPWLLGRMCRGFEKRPELRTMQLPPNQYVRRFWFDTIGYSHEVIDYMVAVVGADRLLMGSDYCYPMAEESPQKGIDTHPRLSDADKLLVLEENAKKLFNL